MQTYTSLKTRGIKIRFWRCPIFNTDVSISYHAFIEHHYASNIRIRYQELDIKTWYVRKWCHMFSYTSVWCHVAPVKAEITGRATRVNLMKRLMTAGGDKKGFGNICWHHLIASFRSGAIWRPEVSEAYGLPTMWRLSSWCHLIGSEGQNLWQIYNVSQCVTMQQTVFGFGGQNLWHIYKL